jgi:hypothetical protein
LDEDGRVCPKSVDYATQCPKGHALAPCAGGGGGGGGADLICRVCHGCRQREHALQWCVCSVAGCCGGYAVCEACVTALGSAPAAGAGGDDFPSVVRGARGPANAHCVERLCAARDPLTAFVAQGVGVVYLLWLKTTFGPSLGRLTVEQVCQMYMRPRSSRSRGSVAQELMAHADTRHHVGEATWFISHTWGNAFVDTLDAVLLFFEGRDDGAAAFVWLDFIVTAQHASAGPSKPSSWWMGTFKQSIARIGSLLLVVDAWDDPAPLRRAWYVLARVCVRACVFSCACELAFTLVCACVCDMCVC